MSSIRSVLPLALLAGACFEGGSGNKDHVVQRSTQLVQYESCGALETDLEEMLIEELAAQIDQIGQYGAGPASEGDGAGSGAGGDNSGGGRQEGEDYSGTNNQEDGVDEADLVKTDGYNVYALNGNRLHVFGVPQFGQLTPISTTPLEGHPTQMLLHEDAKRLAVFSYIDVSALPEQHPLRDLVGYTEDGNDGWYWRSSMLSKITVLDITNNAEPRLVREVFYEGWYQTARRVDETVRVAAHAMIDRRELWDYWQIYEETGSKELTKQIVADRIRALDLADFIPQIYVRTPDGQFHSNSLSNESCQSYYRPTDSHARGISSIISFDLFSSGISWDADHVVSNYPTFYQSKDTIILAEAAHDWWWYWRWQDDPDQLNVHAFDVSQRGRSSYLGSGRVDGYLSDQFAIDEEDGAIRLATTTNLWWRWNDDGDEPTEPESHVWVLERRGSELATVGHVGGIAPGERIMASRFLGDKGYLVTFRQTDPLWTLDLSDNTNPRVVGELMVPGFSTYLHPLTDTSLLSIGVGGDENGANWRTTISLFDVSDFAHPMLTASLPIAGEEGYGWSEALWEHKAFTYWAPKKLLAVPQATYRYDTTNDGDYSYSYVSRLELISVDPVTGLAKHGAIDHSPYYNADNDYYWFYTDIRRSIFMGDYVYAISDKAITAHATSTLTLSAEALLPGYEPGDYYWWW